MTEIMGNELKKLKYIMLSDRRSLKRSETFLRYGIDALVFLVSFYVLLVKLRPSEINVFSTLIRAGVFLLIGLFYQEILGYYRKKRMRVK